MSLEEFGKGHGGAGGTPVPGNAAAGDGSKPAPFSFAQPSAEPREESDQEIVERLAKGVSASKGPTNPFGEKAVFLGGTGKKSDDPLTPFKNLDGSYIDRRTGKSLPKEKWKAEWDGLNGATASAPSPGTLSKKTADQVATVRAVKTNAEKGEFKPSMPLLQVGKNIADAINKLHAFGTKIPTTFHDYYGNQTSDHVRAGFAALDEAKAHLATAQSNITHSPGMAGNNTFDASMSLHKALGHFTQPAIYRRHGMLPEGVTHDTTEGLVSAAAEHSYGMNAAKPSLMHRIGGKDVDILDPKQGPKVIEYMKNATPEEQEIFKKKIMGYKPSTTKPAAKDPEFAKKTAERAEEQASIEEVNKGRKGNVGSVVDVRQASRMADGTMPAGGTSIGRRTTGVGVVDTGTPAREASRVETETARRGELSKVAAAEKEEAARKQAIEDAKPKPEKGPRKKSTSRQPKAASVPTKSMTFDQLINGVKKRGTK
jgi:hypothetical protein